MAIASEKELLGLQFVDQQETKLGAALSWLPLQTASIQDCQLFVKLDQQLKQYFTHQRQQFTLACDLLGTEFQTAVWKCCAEVNFGTTCSYGGLAKTLGKPQTSRAVANALGANPLVILVPCHRIVHSSGTSIGYSGGKWRKIWLLQHERGNND